MMKSYQSNYFVLLHGGPGAKGSLSEIEEHLSNFGYTWTSTQFGNSIEEIENEIIDHLNDSGINKMTLIGHSWGAWLAGILAAKYPERSKKCILISAGPLTQHYSNYIRKTRLSRMNSSLQENYLSIEKKLSEPLTSSKGVKIMKMIQELCWITDNKEPLTGKKKIIAIDFIQHSTLSKEMQKLRQKGILLDKFKSISCPIISIHGAYDPHPSQGISEALKDQPNFKQIIIEECGHNPWIEKKCNNKFYELLSEIVKDQ